MAHVVGRVLTVNLWYASKPGAKMDKDMLAKAIHPSGSQRQGDKNGNSTNHPCG